MRAVENFGSFGNEVDTFRVVAAWARLVSAGVARSAADPASAARRVVVGMVACPPVVSWFRRGRVCCPVARLAALQPWFAGHPANRCRRLGGMGWRQAVCHVLGEHSQPAGQDGTGG